MVRRKATALRGGSSQDGRRDDLLGRRIGTEATSQRPACLASIYHGQRCEGALGVFATIRDVVSELETLQRRVEPAVGAGRLRCRQYKGKYKRRCNLSINLRGAAP